MSALPSSLPAGPAGLPGPGQRLLGKYVVERVLGRGGMGLVVAARHEALGQSVAIKFLAPSGNGTDASEARARLLREARATATLQSEHVVRVFDVGQLETGEPYIAMELLAGEDLSRHLARRGPLPVDEAVHFVLQACEALAEAHRNGIIHRDLKPANLFLTQRADGSPLVKVLDFGISKVMVAPPEQLTTTGEAFGSPHYMSPEQMRDAKSVDQRTDVWALGVILHKLLTGQNPFKAESAAGLCIAIVNEPPEAPRAARPDLPQALEAVILRCLEKDVAKRLPSVAHLASSLAPFAPEEAQAHVRRIDRLSRNGALTLSGSHPSVPSAGDALEKTTADPTVRGWESSSGALRGKSRHNLAGLAGIAVLGAAALLAGAGAAVWATKAGFAQKHVDAVARPAAPPAPPTLTELPPEAARAGPTWATAAEAPASPASAMPPGSAPAAPASAPSSGSQSPPPEGTTRPTPRPPGSAKADSTAAPAPSAAPSAPRDR